MGSVLHVVSGDFAAGALRESGVDGQILVWHDLLYEGVRPVGRPDLPAMQERAEFISAFTGGGLEADKILPTLVEQYELLCDQRWEKIVLWFDACLFDQSMLCHILYCLRNSVTPRENVFLICVGEFAGIEPFHGLGQLTPEQFASFFGSEKVVSAGEFAYCAQAENAFATQSRGELQELADMHSAPLEYVPAAARRLIKEFPTDENPHGHLKSLALAAVCSGLANPQEIYHNVKSNETPPMYWGDTTLWRAINEMADCGLLEITGPGKNLPQWEVGETITDFTVTPIKG